MSEENGSSRLDRIERMLEMVAADHVRFQGQHEVFAKRHEAFEEEHKRLLAAQVLLTDEMAKLAAAQKNTEERLNALIAVVDGIIRRPPAA